VSSTAFAGGVKRPHTPEVVIMYVHTINSLHIAYVLWEMVGIFASASSRIINGQTYVNR
jgi:hypothetical protein